MNCTSECQSWLNAQSRADLGQTKQCCVQQSLEQHITPCHLNCQDLYTHPDQTPGGCPYSPSMRSHQPDGTCTHTHQPDVIELPIEDPHGVGSSALQSAPEADGCLVGQSLLQLRHVDPPPEDPALTACLTLSNCPDASIQSSADEDLFCLFHFCLTLLPLP